MRSLRRLYRRFFPRIADPVLDVSLEIDAGQEAIEKTYLAVLRERERTEIEDFRRYRFREGVRWLRALEALRGEGAPHPGWFVDVGGGNGAIELAFDSAGIRTVSVELEWNDDFRAIRDRTGIPMYRVQARAEALPFRDGALGGAICLDTLEHLSAPAVVAAEMGRVLAVGAPLLLTTPPRLRYLLAPDPHFGIRALLLLPPLLQRVIAAKAGFAQPRHYVERIYSSTRQLASLFNGFRLERVLSRSRSPKRWIWDALMFRRE